MKFKTLSRSKGFTLIELLVVISIIALLSSIIFASVNSAKNQALRIKTQQTIATYVQAINRYYLDNGTIPAPNGQVLTYACLGHYNSNNNCYDDVYGVYATEYPSLNAMLSNYISQLTPLSQNFIGTEDDTVYVYTYNSSTKKAQYIINYPIVGSTCPYIAGIITQGLLWSTGTATYCYIQSDPL